MYSTNSASKDSGNCVPSDATRISCNETESKFTLSNTIISIGDVGNKLQESKETPAPLTYETQKKAT